MTKFTSNDARRLYRSKPKPKRPKRPLETIAEFGGYLRWEEARATILVVPGHERTVRDRIARVLGVRYVFDASPGVVMVHYAVSAIGVDELVRIANGSPVRRVARSPNARRDGERRR